jgi:hypothetical protein
MGFVGDGDPGWPRCSLSGVSTALVGEGIVVVGGPDVAGREAWAARRRVPWPGLPSTSRPPLLQSCRRLSPSLGTVALPAV